MILGAAGMLGSITLDSFTKCGDFEVRATLRDEKSILSLKKLYPGVEFSVLDAETSSEADIKKIINGSNWIVNAIGIIKPYIHDDNAKEVERALKVNSLFPHLLAKAAAGTGTRVIQIATDCVYSGQKGSYIESDTHDALDVYGKTKSIGEAYFDNMLHVRCSIIGPELKSHLSLMDWFLGQDKASELNGFSNHQWNGVTTLHFAKIAQGIIKSNLKISHVQHIVPGNLITKANLLKSFAKNFNREDIKINVVEAPTVVDRTLDTENKEANKKIWKAAGYNEAPTIEQMVTELADYGFPNQAKNI